MCHGPTGQGISSSRTPDFTSPAWQLGKPDKELVDALTNGTDKGMPAFGGQLNTQQIDQLIHCLVRGLAPAPSGR